MRFPTGVGAKIRTTVEMTPADHLSMDEAEATLVGLGHDIVSRNDDNRTFVVLDIEEEAT